MTMEISEDDAQQLRASISAAVLESLGRGAKELNTDPDAYLRLVHAARVASEETSRLLREAIAGARHSDASWELVGNVLGVSRQAAQQRFGAPEQLMPEGAGAPRKRLSPLTAFDEMEVLESEGRMGWHSVGFGTLYHLVEKSPVQWEHRRVLGSVGTRRRRMEEDGWQLIGNNWFPWAYYKRPTNKKALAVG